MSFINTLTPAQRTAYVAEHKKSRASGIMWNVSYCRELDARDENDRKFAALAVKPGQKVKVKVKATKAKAKSKAKSKARVVSAPVVLTEGRFETDLTRITDPVRIKFVNGVTGTITPHHKSENLVKIVLDGVPGYTQPNEVREASDSAKIHLGGKVRRNRDGWYMSVARAALSQTSLTKAGFTLA
ncbi:MAG: hypothetical protein CME17_01125 [Gemmatimonadetes bacterium]|nr:hypothetical protein [Gemmatimonadota bacterium]|tara:strand:+ start:305 stop:859 length:555 start_codon:yes stop_codon:yes gene_type:complete